MSDLLTLTSLKKRLRQIFQTKTQKLRKNISPLRVRPFTPAELKPVPEGWKSTGPDFVGIGAPKSGTGWWYSLLLQHPQIEGHRLLEGEHNNMIINKGLFFFPHFGYKGINELHLETYRQAFAAPEGSICGEFSVQYFCYPHCLNYLSLASSTAKIILILRNPIDRLLSHINHLQIYRIKNQKFTPKQLYVYKTFSLYTEATLHSLYAHGLKQLLRYFDRSQILILQYERCKKSPEEEIARTYKFLGVDEHFKPQDITRAINQRGYVVDALTIQERLNLTSYFSDDVKASIELFPEIDLSLWSDFLPENVTTISPERD
jgi:hypothetical protein